MVSRFKITVVDAARNHSANEGMARPWGREITEMTASKKPS